MTHQILTTSDTEFYRELLAREIELATERMDRYNHWPAGTYYAKDLHAFQELCIPGYVEENLKAPYGEMRILRVGDVFVSTPPDNLFYLINKHEDILGFEDNQRHVWEIKGRGHKVTECTVTFPSREKMIRLSEELRRYPKVRRFVLIDTSDGSIRCVTPDSKCRLQESVDFTPDNKIDGLVFEFYVPQIEYLYGQCRVIFYENKRETKDTVNPLNKRIVVVNGDGKKTGSNYFLPAAEVSKLKALETVQL